MKVKICGIRNEEDLAAAISSDADAVGFLVGVGDGLGVLVGAGFGALVNRLVCMLTVATPFVFMP